MTSTKKQPETLEAAAQELRQAYHQLAYTLAQELGGYIAFVDQAEETLRRLFGTAEKMETAIRGELGLAPPKKQGKTRRAA